MRVIELAAGSVRTQSMLREGRPVEWRGFELVVEIASPTRAVLEHRREEVEGMLRRAAGKKVALVVRPPPGEGEQSDAPPPASAEQLAREHPLVKHAMEAFGGRVETAYFKKKP
jgi:hypothetical protein